MSKFSLAAMATALVLLGACATPTPYQQATESGQGYSEQKIEANRFMVEFSGNSLTDRKTVETYLLYRAAELTRLNGYDYFEVVRRETDADSKLVGKGFPTYSPYYDHFFIDYAYYGPHAAYFYDPFRPRSRFYDPFWGGPQEYREVTKYVASAEIILGKGEKPDDAAYFNAEEVMLNLASAIVYPQAD